jgi:hypothetical protein
MNEKKHIYYPYTQRNREEWKEESRGNREGKKKKILTIYFGLKQIVVK